MRIPVSNEEKSKNLSGIGTGSLLRKQREKEIDEMNKIAEEMVANLSTIKKYTQWDYTCLSLMMLMNVVAVTPDLQPHFKPLLGKILDANIAVKAMWKDGILPK